MALSAGKSSLGLQALAGGTENCYTKATNSTGDGIEAFRVGVDSSASAGALFWLNGDTANKVYVAPGDSTVLKSYREISSLDASGTAADNVHWASIIDR